MSITIALVGGWLAGCLVATWTRRLLAGDESWRAPARSRLLAPDPAMQLGTAAIWAGLALQRGISWEWLASAALAVVLVQVAATDARHHFVYLVFVGGGLLAGVALSPLVHHADVWGGVLGALLEGAALLAAYFVGRVVYRRGEPLARGDVAIGAMAGAAAGPHVVTALTVGVLANAVFALLVLMVRRPRHTPMPYGPGLCAGALVSLFLGL